MGGLRSRTVLVGVGAAVTAGLLAGCTGGPPPSPPTPSLQIDPGDGGDYRPELDPDETVARIDNQYFPVVVGSRWVYEGESDGRPRRVHVLVTDDRRQVYGINAVVVRSRISELGALLEETEVWYTQDSEGNVWQLGERIARYENGEVISNAGSWAAGVGGALPGIVMPADPEIGDVHREEFWPGRAEDLMQVIEVDADAVVPAGTFTNVVVLREWSPLDPVSVAAQSFAPGVGLVRGETVAGGSGRFALVDYRIGA